ncbi:hypothetical protein CRUP_003503 [Coryphaenoides rupestris]|nr:hypothetical protein CRUP_003503 [Coryphaenoides rupestris]
MEAKEGGVLNLRQIMAVFQEEEEEEEEEEVVVVVEEEEEVVLVEVDYNCNSLSAALEVKKLQALVRSLERQNQQLRSRRDATSSTSNFQYKNNNNNKNKKNNNNNNTLPSGVLECSPDEEEPAALLDGVEELDLDGLFPGDSDEETWLYVSCREGVCGDSPPLSPLQWCRQMLDSPRSEDAKRTPSLHLPQGVAPLRFQPLPILSCPVSCDGGVAQQCLLPPPHRQVLLHPAVLPTTRLPAGLPFAPVPEGVPESPVKEPLPPAERSPTFLPHLAGRSRRSGLSPERSDDDEGDFIALGYKLHDLTDVQVMARLQEESLRQDYASVAPRPERRGSPSLRSPLLSHEDKDDVFGLFPPLPHSVPPPSSPGSAPFSSARDLRLAGHAPGHAPDLPRPDARLRTLLLPPVRTGPVGPGPARSQDLRPGSDKLGWSMPNLVRAPSMPSVPASASQRAPVSLLRNSLSFDSSVQLQPSIQLQNRVGRFSSSPGQPLKATAYVSPTIKGSVAVPTGIPMLGCRTPTQPTASRSCLPRPATSSAPRKRIAQLARSLSTPPKSLAPPSALRHAGWKDGCY